MKSSHYSRQEVFRAPRLSGDVRLQSENDLLIRWRLAGDVVLAIVNLGWTLAYCFSEARYTTTPPSSARVAAAGMITIGVNTELQPCP